MGDITVKKFHLGPPPKGNVAADEYFPTNPEDPLHQALRDISCACFQIKPADYDLHRYEHGTINVFYKDAEPIGYNLLAMNFYTVGGEARFVIKAGPSAMTEAGRGHNRVAKDLMRMLIQETVKVVLHGLLHGRRQGVDFLINAANPHYRKIAKNLPSDHADERLGAAIRAVYPPEVAEHLAGIKNGELVETAWAPKGAPREARPYLVEVSPKNLYLGAWMSLFGGVPDRSRSDHEVSPLAGVDMAALVELVELLCPEAETDAVAAEVQLAVDKLAEMPITAFCPAKL